MSDCGCGGSCGCGGGSHAQALDFAEESRPPSAASDLSVRVGAVERALLAMAQENLTDIPE